MFFQRCEPGFVLQGGVDGASNRTSTSPPITGWDIATRFIAATNQTPPFPPQVASEFNVGPLIHNRFGTIAMALVTGEPDSATSSFFFNLADNSTNLDFQSGGFTVFGRILNGTNVLQYFNSLNTGIGIVANSTFLDDGTLISNQPFPTLPVNYTGSSNAANANLVFCDFSFVTTPPVDTNPPTVSITNPAPNALLTNSLEGTASDDVGLAVVICVLTLHGTNGTFPSPYTNGAPVTNYAVGTTNWSLSLNPGIYNVNVQSQDGAGNLSPPVVELITNTAIFIVGNGTAAFTNATLTNFNPVGYPVQLGSNYGVQAIPGSNQTFVSWSDGAYTTTNETIPFLYEGDVFTATIISNQSNGIAFTFPLANAMLSNTLFDISGTISTAVLSPPVTVTCQIFTNTTTNYAVTTPQSTTTSTTNWSVSVTNYLPTGSYFIQALATDHLGNNTLITENFRFTASTNPSVVSITSPAPNVLLFEDSPMIFQGTASNNVLPLVSVICTLVPQTNSDGTVPHSGVSFSGTATGTNNWSLDLETLGDVPPGAYLFMAQAQDAAGNLSPAASQALTISGVLIDGDGTVSLVLGTNVTTNAVGYPLQIGGNYNVKATPGTGQIFLHWLYKNTISTNAYLTNFPYEGDLLTVTFIPTNTPKGTKGISFTYPKANEVLATNSFILRGKIAASVGSAQVTCQLSSLSTGLEVGPPLTASGKNTWSIAVSNLPPDGYLVQAVGTNAKGFSTAISEEFTVQAFKGVAGTYNGLFICTTEAVAPTNSGFITLTLTDSGTFSAKLLFPAYGPVPTDYHFSIDGSMELPYPLILGNPLSVNLSLDVTNGTDSLTGTVSGRTWSSEIVCYRAVTKLSIHTTPATGKYILSLDPINGPNTNGYAALSIGSGGTIALSGALPDGATFSQSARVSKHGVWPFYVVPAGYKTNGMLMGWETNLASGYCSGQLYWCKAPGVGTYYTTGVNTDMNSTGTNYNHPAAGNYTIVFQGGTLSVPVTNQLSVAGTGGQFKPVNPNDKLTISLSSAGVLTGHFLNPNDNKTLQFKGAFFGQSQGGSGFILEGGSQTGYFSLEAQ